MIVKITGYRRGSHGIWYSNKIGQCFKVDGKINRVWGFDAYRELSSGRSIAVEDCIDITRELKFKRILKNEIEIT